MVKSYARRRIGTVDGVEVHQDMAATELGFPSDWPFSYIKPGEFRGRGLGMYKYLASAQEGDRFEFISRTDSHRHPANHSNAGRIGGALIGEVLPEDPTTIRVVWLEAVEPEMGHGTKLVRAMEKWARENGFEMVILDSRSSAYGFWVKMGYYLHPETAAVILENRDLFTGFTEDQLDDYMTEVDEEGTIPDALFEEHPGALPDPILMEKDLT